MVRLAKFSTSPTDRIGYGVGALTSRDDEAHPKLVSSSKGPENIDAYLDRKINGFLAGPAGWLVFSAHGLDEEGWGWISSDYLDRLLVRLVKTPGVAILPVGLSQR